MPAVLIRLARAASGALATGYYLYKIYGQRGPEVFITFNDADGIRPRDTPLNYRGVRVGNSVLRVELTEERDRVLVGVRVDGAYQDIVARDGAEILDRPPRNRRRDADRAQHRH